MPTDISNALGTARQFTPRPDATYREKPSGLSALQHSAAQFTNHALVAENLSKLTNAMQNYNMSNEKRQEEWGLEKATRLINGMTAEDIVSLDVLDAAQQEGYMDVADNPYFKAHAERLRGEFTATEARRAYDEKFAQLPAESADAEMSRWDDFRTKWANDNTKLPLNQVAFDEGFNKNGMVNRTMIGNEYSKKQIEELQMNTIAEVRAQLSQVQLNATEILQTPNLMSTQVQEILNDARLAGVPAPLKYQIAQQFIDGLIKTGKITPERALQMMDSVTIQTNMDGTRKPLSAVTDPFTVQVTADNYQNKHFTEEKFKFMQEYENDLNPDRAYAYLASIQYTNPTEYAAKASLMDSLISRQEANKRRKAAEARQAAKDAAKSSKGSVSISTYVSDGLLGSFISGGRKLPMTLKELGVTADEAFGWYVNNSKDFPPNEKLQILSLPAFSEINKMVREDAQRSFYQITPELLNNPNQRQRIIEKLNGYAQLYQANPNMFQGVYGNELGDQMTAYMRLSESSTPDDAVLSMANYMSTVHDDRDIAQKVNKMIDDEEPLSLTTLDGQNVELNWEDDEYAYSRIKAKTLACIGAGMSYERAYAEASKEARGMMQVYTYCGMTTVLPSHLLEGTGFDNKAVDDCITNIVEEVRDGKDAANMSIKWDDKANTLQINCFGSTRKPRTFTKAELQEAIRWQQDQNNTTGAAEKERIRKKRTVEEGVVQSEDPLIYLNTPPEDIVMNGD